MTISQRRFCAGEASIRVASRAWMLVVLVACVASAASAQQASDERILTLVAPDKSARTEDVGSYVVYQNDRAARIAGTAGQRDAGRIRAVGSAKPDMLYNGKKLHQAGVIAAPIVEGDLTSGYELAIGASWGPENVIREAIGKIDPLLPKTPFRQDKWPREDQALHEHGRYALPFIKARTAMETHLARTLAEVFDRSVLTYVISRPPEPIPQRPDASVLALHKPFAPTPEAIAALRLGPQALPVLRDLEKTMRANGNLTALQSQWIEFLAREYEVLQRGINLALVGGTLPGADGDVTFAGLQRGDVLAEDNVSEWPVPEQLLVRVYRQAAQRSIEGLRATFYDYGAKSEWLLRKIRENATRNLLEELETLQLAGQFDEQYFGNPTGGNINPLQGFENVHNLLTLLICSEEISIETGNRITAYQALTDSLDEDVRKEALKKLEIMNFLRRMLREHIDEQRIVVVADRVNLIRGAPLRFHELLQEFEENFTLEPYRTLCAIERQRAVAALYRGKFNWHFDQIRARDQQAASNLYVSASEQLARSRGLELRAGELESLRYNGWVEFDDQWLRTRGISGVEVNAMLGSGLLERQSDTSYRYYGHSDYRRLVKLTDADYQVLIDQGYLEIPGQDSFRGDPDNDGRTYDFQNSTNRKGLSLDLLPDDSGYVFELQQGRSYELEFQFYATGMQGENTWIRFVPLDENGESMASRYAKERDELAEAGRIVPFEWVHDGMANEMQSRRMTGGTGGKWMTYRLKLRTVPVDVHGFTMEIKLDSFAGRGSFFYRNFKLRLLQDFFHEDFEPETYGSDAPPPVTGPSLDDLLPSEAWMLVEDKQRNYMPYSQLRFNNLVKPENGESRSLQIEPNGYNVRLETRKFFRLDVYKGYEFSGQMMVENLGEMRAYFELLLYDENKQPVTVDGIPCAEGENIMRTPARRDSATTLGWESVDAIDGWYEERLQLDNRKVMDVSRRFDPRLESLLPERRDIDYARIAIVVEGVTPTYTGRVYIDNLQLKEYPRVVPRLGQLIQPEVTDPRAAIESNFSHWDLEFERHLLVRYKPREDGRKTRRFINFEVDGLIPERLGYHYTIRLFDYTGREIQAANLLGAEKLDKIVVSDENGNLRGDYAIPRIYFDELGLQDRYGYFRAAFELRYANETEPLVRRDFVFGYVPPPLEGEADPGDLGVILDHNSEMTAGVLAALKMLSAGKVGVPLFHPGMDVTADTYATQAWIDTYRRWTRMMPGIEMSGVLSNLPQSLTSVSIEQGASPIFADQRRQDWKDMLGRVQRLWDATFDSYVVGAEDEQSYCAFSGDASRALNNLEAEFTANRQGWSRRELPVMLGNAETTRDHLEALVKSFRDRWTPALDAMSQENRDAIAAALRPEDRQRLRAAFPELLWLHDKERLSFFIPESLTTQDMLDNLKTSLALVGRFANVLGDSAADVQANASALASGQSVDFSPMATLLRSPAEHTLILELKAVDPRRGINFSDQLRDLTEKIVAAREMGFTRIFVNRLRNTGDIANGLLTRTNDPQPAFFALRTLNSLLSHRDRLPMTLDLKSGAANAFFRHKENGQLTFIIFPGSTDAVEDLPLGSSVKQVDLMGNLIDIRPTRREGLATGMVSVALPARGVPVVLTGIDTALMETVLSVNLSDTTIQAEQKDQAEVLTLTNRFDVPATVLLEIPLLSEEGDRSNIAYDTLFRDARGQEVSPRLERMTFPSVLLAPGETQTYRFSMQPLNTMGTGKRTLPVRLRLKARNEYIVDHRLTLDVVPQVEVLSAAVVLPDEAPLIDVVLNVSNLAGRDARFIAVVGLPNVAESRPRERSFALAANGSDKVTVSLPRQGLSELEGQLVSVSLRESPGTLFFNQEYRVRANKLTGALELVSVESIRQAEANLR